jgi:hypothetical protein
MLNSTFVEEYALTVYVMSRDVPWFIKFLDIYKVYQTIQYLGAMACYYASMWWPTGLFMIAFWTTLNSHLGVSEKLQKRMDVLDTLVVNLHARIDEKDRELNEVYDRVMQTIKVVEIIIGRLDTIQLQTNATDAKLLGLEEKVERLVANTNETSHRQSILITENQIQIDATDDKLLELEETVERMMVRTNEIPRLGTEIDELRVTLNRTDFGLDSLGTDVGGLMCIRRDTHINMYIHPLEVVQGIAVTHSKSRSYWPSLYAFQRDNSPEVHSTEIIMKGICADNIGSSTRARKGDLCIDWIRLGEFPYLFNLTIIADAYHGFTQYASSKTLEILVVTSRNENGIMARDNCGPYKEYPLVSYNWLHRFPSLETLDFSGISVDLLSTSDIAECMFLEGFPKLRVIRGVGSKTNMKLVQYCSTKGIVLE